MTPGEDLVLIVLKGHLLIEQQLNRIIESIVAHGNLMDGIRFNLITAQQAG
jgi:hypothetical protein